MSNEAKDTTTQLSSLKAIAEQAVVQANLFTSSGKLPGDNDALRSKCTISTSTQLYRLDF